MMISKSSGAAIGLAVIVVLLVIAIVLIFTLKGNLGHAKNPSVKKPSSATSTQLLAEAAMFAPHAPTEVTCVTGLYDINRKKFDGREIASYKAWLMDTVAALHVPMVVYLDATLGWKSDVLRHRPFGHPTIVLETKLQNVPAYKYRPAISAALDNKSYQRNPDNLVNKTPDYAVVIYSKLFWLEEVASVNPFNSSRFAWVDAGLSRFKSVQKKTTFKDPWPNDGMFHINRNSDFNGDHKTYDEFIGQNGPGTAGGNFVACKHALRIVKAEMIRILEDEMLKKKKIDTEEVAFIFAYQNTGIVQLHEPRQYGWLDAFFKDE
jgi:hypothetical protein